MKKLKAVALVVASLSFSVVPPVYGQEIGESTSSNLEETAETLGQEIRFVRYVDDASTSDTVGPKALRQEFGPCVLTPQNLHQRASVAGAIGFKAVVDCSEPVSSINLTSEIRYKWLAWWRTAVSNIQSSNRNQMKLTQRNISYECKGNAPHDFMGGTKGEIVWNGKTYYASVLTKPSRLEYGV